MAKTASISLRIEPAVKAQLEALYASFGISVTDAINIFLHTSLMEGGFPFQPKQPRYNAETEAAIQETKDILAGKIKAKSYANVKEINRTKILRGGVRFPTGGIPVKVSPRAERHDLVRFQSRQYSLDERRLHNRKPLF